MPHKNFTFLTLLVTLQCLAQAWACATPHEYAKRAEGEEVEYPWAEPGDEAPSDPTTVAYFMNHISINVRDMTESINWYREAFGFRLLFNLHVSENFAIAYIGHAHGGRNGSGYQTSEEMNREKNNGEGLIELIELKYPNWDLPSGLRVPNTLSHIGMVVPNSTVTHERLKAMGANILKAPGEVFVLNGWFSLGTGFDQAGDFLSPEEIDLITESLIPINTPTLYTADPDGNVIEVQNQEAFIPSY
ncbi:uncharacterized protein A1O9_09372 [Exophiala aquamarina CBS 119918]|uniref:VOC domain-containing protein n=1 Tax=Exophiala aquamarina CBS 119918 TaxID=1182545 RepID=A0A072P4A7_9EURO|nr:uncharacterized protein A1O9_09372 [Exophiala aquamarina CBS 119918]KEF54929.1 hypothetical protein A1O9_09372 [Exophiala aquamarina CBS 119918]